MTRCRLNRIKRYSKTGICVKLQAAGRRPTADSDHGEQEHENENENEGLRARARPFLQLTTAN